jgi:hypothetical protein
MMGLSDLVNADNVLYILLVCVLFNDAANY